MSTALGVLTLAVIKVEVFKEILNFKTSFLIDMLTALKGSQFYYYSLLTLIVEIGFEHSRFVSLHVTAE